MITIEQAVLLAAARQVAEVVPGRTTIPITANMLIEAADGRVTLTGTDLDLMLSVSVADAGHGGDMTITANAAKLVAALGSFRAGLVTLKAEGGRLTVAQGRGRRTIATLPATDFPKRRVEDERARFTLPAAALLRLFDMTHVAMSTEETRYYMCGVYLHVVDRRLTAAASDGFRMVRAQAVAIDGIGEPPGVIVSSKTVTQLRKLLTKRADEIELVLTERAIVATIGDSLINAALIDGTFPDYSRIIPPEDAAQVLSFVRDELLEPSAQVVAVVDAEGDKTRVRTVRLVLTDEQPAVAARDQAGSEASEPIGVAVDGARFDWGMNQAYLASILRLFAEDARVRIAIADAKAPARIASDKDPDVLAVIMPMRI